MDFSQFDALAKKVENAVSIIEELKRERDSLRSELHVAMEKSGDLEKVVTQKDEELGSLRNELNNKSDNINSLGERIRDMVNRLDTALA